MPLPFQASYLLVDWLLALKRYTVVKLQPIALLCKSLGVCGDVFSGKFFTVGLLKSKGKCTIN